MINATVYKNISDSLGTIIESFRVTRISSQMIFSGLASLENVATNTLTKISDNEVTRILSPAQAASMAISVTNSDPSRDMVLVSLTHALQNHILKYFGNINIFLSDNNIKLNQSFAEFSGDLGYAIDTGNIG